jgi:shikimate 5-dehydrogenase
MTAWLCCAVKKRSTRWAEIARNHRGGMMALEDVSIVKKYQPTFYFVGVTTARSSIMKVFPLWMKVLGRTEVVIEGMDLKIHDTREAYRAATNQIKQDTLSLGGLVTTHKIDLLNASRDLFEYLDPYAQICGEISSISKLEGRLEGHAKDPITAGLSLDAIVGPGYFGRTGAEALILGAGGSGMATLLHLMEKKHPADRPRRVVMVNRSPGRLEHLREMVERIGTDIQVEYVCNTDALVNDRLMEGLADFSLVINATGMGKDTPGSPLSSHGLFPRKGIVWEFNYRGELDFMHQALAQVSTREVRVEDGWLYFVHGWTQVVAQVLHIDLTPEVFAQLEAAAAQTR